MKGGDFTQSRNKRMIAFFLLLTANLESPLYSLFCLFVLQDLFYAGVSFSQSLFLEENRGVKLLNYFFYYFWTSIHAF